MLITMFTDKVFDKKICKTSFISLIMQKQKLAQENVSNQTSSNKALTKSIRNASMKIEYPIEYLEQNNF